MSTNKEKTYIFLLILLTLLFFLPGVFSPRDFWVEDEARYAEILREMIFDGKWLVPHLNGTFYADKPPLYFWLCAGTSLLGGITPWTCMLVTWFSALGSVFGAYCFGKTLFSSRAGFFGALSLMSTLLFLGCAQIVRMDMLLTCFVLWALYFFYTGYLKGERRYYFLFYFFTALAVLSKGPFGFTFTFLPPLFTLLFKKDFRGLARFIFHWGFLLPFMMVGGWLLPAWLSGQREFIHDLFFKQMAGRAVKSFSHREPFYYYLVILPFSLLPWFPFLIRSTIEGFRHHRQHTLFLLIFFLTGFITLSAVSSKLVVYLLPLLAPWSLLFGASLDRMLDRHKVMDFIFSIEACISMVCTLGLFAAIPFIAHFFPIIHRMNVMPLTTIFLPLFAAGILFVLLKKPRFVLILLFSGMWIVSCFCFLKLVPQANGIFSAREIGVRIRTACEEGMEVSSYDVRRGILNFYAGRNIPSVSTKDLSTYFENPDRCLVMKRKHFEKYRNILGAHVRIDPVYEIANEYYGIVKTGEYP